MEFEMRLRAPDWKESPSASMVKSCAKKINPKKKSQCE